MSGEIAPSILPPKSPPRPNPLRFIIDHNPCFILSALLMFLGCYLLNCAMDVRAADIGKSLALLATINLYELALIALAFALFPKTKGPGRDAALLLFVELLFLADGPFLIAQVVQVPSAWGWIIATILAALAILKAGAVLRAARIPLRLSTLGLFAANLLLIYILPLILAHLSTAGELPPNTLYYLWWIVGLLPAAYELLARFSAITIALSARQQFLRRSCIIIPWLLLVAHLGFFHWIYRAEFFAADLAPVLLGLTIASRRIAPRPLLPQSQLRFARIVTPIIALILAAWGGRDLRLTFPFTTLEITPTLLTAAAVLVTYGYLHSLTAALSALATNVFMLLGRIFIAEIISALDWLLKGFLYLANRCLILLNNIIPTTPTAWGILAIIAAFLLLALGSFFSLRPQPHEQPPA